MLHNEIGEIVDPATTKELTEMSYADLKKYAHAAARTAGLQEEQHDAFLELCRRVDNMIVGQMKVIYV